MRQLDGNSRSADLQLNTDATGQDTSDRRRTDALPKDTDDESRAADKNQAAYQSREVDRSAEGFAQPCQHPGRDEPSYARSRDPTAETLENGLPVPEFCIAKADYSSLGSGYLRLSKGKEVQVLMKGSQEDGEDAVGWFFGHSFASRSKETDWFPQEEVILLYDVRFFFLAPTPAELEISDQSQLQMQVT